MKLRSHLSQTPLPRQVLMGKLISEPMNNIRTKSRIYEQHPVQNCGGVLNVMAEFASPSIEEGARKFK